jgi:predicted transcriptional regulator
LKQVEPIPEEFTSYEEAAEFWDSHDTTDYPDAFRTVEDIQIEQIAYIFSPRLAHPEQAADFEMEIVEKP